MKGFFVFISKAVGVMLLVVSSPLVLLGVWILTHPRLKSPGSSSANNFADVVEFAVPETDKAIDRSAASIH